ncbi:MAG: CoA transferase [Alphaproteobacteria bacterium]|nr:CoA transferase [Alphaproteobacteria bacterium]
MKKSLQNIRVLDLSRVLAGPYCTQILGDLGAEIIKIEKPGAGDDTRLWGPPFLKDRSGNDTNESAYYLAINRNKKSVAVDIKTEEGQQIIHQLLQTSDILIENFKVGGLKKYGLGYAQLKDKYPKLIYCSITGFGQSGPLAEEPGYDLMAQAMGGLMGVTGESDGPPMKVGVALSDIITGLNATIGILSALHHRERTGEGQLIDVALVDCTLASLANLAQYFLITGKIAPRLGNAHSTIVPYQAFQVKDGYIVVAVGNNEQFARFCRMIGKPAWAEDERFAKNKNRVVNRETLVPMIEEALKSQTSATWVEKMRAADIPGGPVNKVDEVFAMPQVQHREMEISIEHVQSSAPIKLVGSPLKFSQTPVSYEFSPPILGQDTQEVLENVLNLSAERLDELEKAGVIERAKTS